MGRTVPSFTMALMHEESEWRLYRSCLEPKLRKTLDNLFAIPKLYIAPCVYCANPVVMDLVFMSIFFHHHCQLVGLIERVENLTGERYHDSVSA